MASARAESGTRWPKSDSRRLPVKFLMQFWAKPVVRDAQGLQPAGRMRGAMPPDDWGDSVAVEGVTAYGRRRARARPCVAVREDALAPTRVIPESLRYVPRAPGPCGPRGRPSRLHDAREPTRRRPRPGDASTRAHVARRVAPPREPGQSRGRPRSPERPRQARIIAHERLRAHRAIATPSLQGADSATLTRPSLRAASQLAPQSPETRRYDPSQGSDEFATPERPSGTPAPLPDEV